MPKVGFGGAEDIGRTVPVPWDRIVPLGSANWMQHDTAMFCTRTCPCLSKHEKGKTGRTSWTQMLWILFVFGNRQFAADPFVRTALCAELR